MFEIEFIYSPIINFAMQQNHVPIIRKISIKNISEKDIENVSLVIKSDPDFSDEWKRNIDCIKKDEIIEVSAIQLKISGKYLAELTERISGDFLLTITSINDILYSSSYKTDLLAYDQWNGINILPELLVTFITPNHPQLPKVIKRASEILSKWTGDPSFNEYQSRNPDRVRKQMAAIYEAIAEMEIVYCSVPASFEDSGQRIRMCDTIFSTQMGNCLDMSLLFAACLEAVGIHPIIIIIKGHAFAGAWLIDESFADSVNDDSSLITKRTADGINEIVLVESTCMNAGKNIPFDDAVTAANFKMVNENDFILFIDVKRSRFSSIRPLPLRVKTQDGWEIIEEKITERNSDAPEEITIGRKLMNVDKIDVSKQKLWERKLLDLTLRNNLLNLRITKSTIQFISISVAKLEDSLANGDELQILSKPTDWDNPLRNAGVYQSVHQSDPISDLIRNELTQKRLRAYLTESELLYSVVSLFRASRLSIEENGANTLYIAIGLLKWFETEVSEKPRYAPILLVPVEIVKKSAQKGFTIKSREEETMVNITLLEMLRQDFGINIGGLETLPKDESGVDVKAVFNIFRQVIMAKRGWDVEEQAVLSTFSFSKFILWNDIHNNADQLFKNKIVGSLVSGKLEWKPSLVEGQFDLDKDIYPTDVALPISADSSQLQAIISSAKNESFVLHGPPGTGKSQTITNIISNALYQGKKVLFVSAKKAALDVVNSRLNAIGIGNFCLELHSNKSKKSAVLEQLRKTTEIIKNHSPQNYQSEAERLFALRSELNEYVKVLHKKYHFGYSLFELFSQYSELRKASDKVYFSSTEIDGIDESKLATWKDTIEEIQTIGSIIIHPHNHTLDAIHTNLYTQQIKADAIQNIISYRDLLNKYKTILPEVISILKVEIPIISKPQAEKIRHIAAILLSLPDIPAQLFGIEHAEQNLSQIITLSEHGNKRNILRSELLQQFNKKILLLDAEQELSNWNIAGQQWFLPKLLKQGAIIKSFKSLSSNGTIDKRKIPDYLNKIIAYKNEQAIIDKANILPQFLGFLWQDGECDWDKIIIISNAILSINREASLLGELFIAGKWRINLSQYFYEGSKAYFEKHKLILEEYNGLLTDIKKTEKTLQDLLGIDFLKLKGIADNWQECSRMYAEQWLKNIDSLKDWVSWIQTREKAITQGLMPVISVYENGGIESAEILTEYKRGLYKSCANYIIDHESSLSSFNGKLFEEKIKRFREISKQFEQLTKLELYARLASKIPDFAQEASQSSEIGILQKTIKNNGRAMSIRKLFDLIPNLLPRLTPCMLMSPISVAQYFDTNNEKFDLVVFDEASQMPTCEAVGAIARATNVIVVGDPKQMPPTSFFSSNNIDEENIDKEDLESILDDCLALSMPSRHLLWHYRSKHESLIAFSNAKYYDNQLLTFPSTDDITSKVTYINIEGYYDKGKTRQNSFEAKAIVDEIVRRLSDPILSKKSMGIVTFSVAQQILIDDLLNEVFKSRPDLEKQVMEAEEPLFIKNLENVQGDERDVILFSVGYGPDKEGKVSLNFGPINREGGWRRLNVAVSRARYEMKVFSTLRSDQIDLARTSSEGVAGLKAFLAYAEKGKSALPNRVASKSTRETSFEKMLAEKIKQYGYDVHIDIGCSAYKIDMGIVDITDSNKYILGVLCDGHNYFKANTSRDREIVQPEVLKTLGWKIHKVWSADWWENPEKTLNEVVDAIKKAEEQKDEVEVLEDIGIETFLKPVEHVLNQVVSTIPNPALKQDESIINYEICDLDIVPSNSSDDFLMISNRAKIVSQLIKVLEVEAPISKSLLCKRVLSAWGINRNGTRLNAYFETLFNDLNFCQTRHGNNAFFWKPEQNPTVYFNYRISKNEFEKRDAEDLPPEEIAYAAKQVLKNQISLLRIDLIRETAKLFGFARIGSNVENAMNQGIEIVIKSNWALNENNRIVYKL
jgi:uncharacterized protein DUF4011/restriction endonuclease-like protein/AAA domain-containing protein/uncharacterized protein DUF3320